MSSTSSAGTPKLSGRRRVGAPPTMGVATNSKKRLSLRDNGSSNESTAEEEVEDRKRARRSLRSDRPSVSSENSSESDVKHSASKPSSSKIVRSSKPKHKSPRHVRSRKVAKRSSKKRNKKMNEEEEEEEEPEQMEEEEEDDDTDSMDGVDLSWKPDIMKAYNKARKFFENMVSTEGSNTLDSHINAYRTYAYCEQFDSLDFEVRRHDPKKKMPILPLERVEPLPPMPYWTLTEMNIKVEDEYTLSHVPFMADLEDPDAFCKELMESFPDGIHGTKVGCGEYINDFILYSMVKSIEEERPEIPRAKLFRLIYELFPNKAQKNELEEIYPDLRARFEPHLVPSAVPFDENGLQRVNVTPESLLHSFEVLQCRRCALYDCPHHFSDMYDDYRPKRQADHSHIISATTPCGENCYLSLENGTSKIKSEGSKSLSSNISIDVSLNEANWSPQEESMIALLRSVGIHDFCLIARTLYCERGSKMDKTCVDVYKYFHRQGPLSPTVNVPREKPKKKRYDQLHRAFRTMKWAGDGAVRNQHAYVPCSHDGPCDESCHCYQRDRICTKYCACYARDCKIQFPGCRCQPGNCRTKQCPCYYASWECDPDNCKSCMCGPEHTNMFDSHNRCKNICFQRGLQKKLSVRPSQIAGWGCFADEPMDKNDFISEYCGEIVSVEESERRGKIYDKQKCSYLFALNNEYQVDATRKGNLIRFANHSSAPNCYAKVVVVNSEHRIGIFANRAIDRGEELFFNYAYSKNHQLTFLNLELDRNNKVVMLKKEKDLNTKRVRTANATASGSKSKTNSRRALRST